MKSIYKFPIKRVTDVVQIEMPVGAQVLCVQVQHETPCIWAIVDTEAATEPRYFEIYGTGNPLPDHLDVEYDTKYIGTFQLHEGGFVGHVFEPAR